MEITQLIEINKQKMMWNVLLNSVYHTAISVDSDDIFQTTKTKAVQSQMYFI